MEFGNFKFYGGGWGVKEEENKKKLFWRFTLFGRHSLGRGSQIGCTFKFDSGEIVTLTFNLTELFNYKIFHLLFKQIKASLCRP